MNTLLVERHYSDGLLEIIRMHLGYSALHPSASATAKMLSISRETEAKTIRNQQVTRSSRVAGSKIPLKNIELRRTQAVSSVLRWTDGGRTGRQSVSPFSAGRELPLGKPSGRPPDITPRQVASAAPAICLLVVSEPGSLVVSEPGSEAERDPVGDVFTYRGANFN